MIKKTILLVIVLIIVTIGISFCLTLTEEKINLEKSIQQKVEDIILKIIGSKNFVVSVSVEIKTPEQPQVSNLDLNKPLYPGFYIREEEYLPGVTYSYLPVTNPSTNLPMQLVIDKIIINIAVDISLSDSVINRIKSEVPAFLGLNTMRGDTINVTKIQFQKTPTWQMILEQMMPHLYIPLVILVISLFLFGPVTHFFKTVVKAVQLRIEADARLRSTEKTEISGQTQTGLLPGLEVPGLPGGGGIGGGSLELSVGGKKEEKPRKLFDFINKSNLKNLWYLIKDEPPSTIALVLNYLPSDLASEFMMMLDNKTQAKVALELASVKLPDPQEVQEIENNIKLRIDYCIGGEEYFLSLLDQADKDVQEDILHTLSIQNPSLAEKLREKIFLFEDILFLDKTTLQKIIRETQRRGISLAIALKGTSEEIKNKIMDCLTEGGRAMLAEQIDLLGEIGEKVIKTEQKKIVATIRDLLNAGEITIDRSKFVKEQIEKQKSLTVEPEVIEKRK
ncbi:MAG: FliG C-terminal domain-containing protein [Elusimicrobiota bacterium]|nr:hypothetical protein [Endomicrobiia bacterium]MDW8165813.1 FliG C-terminal domain-containing protein [Elusimicrobiota bacterium]